MKLVTILRKLRTPKREKWKTIIDVNSVNGVITSNDSASEIKRKVNHQFR